MSPSETEPVIQLALPQRIAWLESVLNFQANRGEQYQGLCRKGCNEGTIHNRWRTMLGDVLQNYFPNYVSFKGSWK